MGFASLSLASTPRGFVALDERVGSGVSGRVVIRAPAHLHSAIAAHVVRRARMSGRVAVVGSPGAAVPLFQDVAMQLADSNGAVIVGPLPADGSWDAARAEELELTALLVFLSTDTGEIEIDARLSPDERARWFAALSAEPAADDLGALQQWWTPTSSVPHDALIATTLAGRPLQAAALRSLGIAIDGDERVSGATVDTSAASDELRRSIATLLLSDTDPWAHARAAELFVAIGEIENANDAIGRALRSGQDANTIGERWFGIVSYTTDINLRLKAAERALAAGEAVNAKRWCESAARLERKEPLVHILLARAHVQLGDLVTARVCLDRAERDCDSESSNDVRIEAERAEVCFLSGKLDEAVAHATNALPSLAARGTLGKVLLARGEWDLADAHFAEDALTASTANDVTALLRARLNRAIALLSRGRLDDARTMLLAVLADGKAAKEERACAHAHSNLGLIAYRKHDYARALEHWEETVRFPQAVRGRIPTAITIGNLAELRLRLGLVDHAEHAIAFGRKLLGEHVPTKISALFAWVSAQIALAHGDTDLARKHIHAALTDAEASGERDYLESAHLVSARVALEDGDLGQVARAIENARSVVKSERARAELGILHATHLRALGRSALEAANEALVVAQTSGDEDLLYELYTLLALIHRDLGDDERGASFQRRAASIRERIAASLPEDLQAIFLAKHREPEPPRSIPTPPPTPIPATRVSIVGDDPQMQSLAIAIRKVARTTSTVLVSGESGTGKELVAEAIHRASDRASGPLVTVNCAALVETLLLSELFGHEKGAFTGATNRRRGRFELAEGGTLFLDEIGDISARTQVALLRVLQDKTFERVGGTTSLTANVRVICATHRDLRGMVDAGEFREDLYYRLRQITLEVPPLRARIGDLPKLAKHILDRIDSTKRLAPSAIEELSRHRWPGNVRELENILRAAAVFADGEVIEAEDFASTSFEPSAPAPRSTSTPSLNAPPPSSSSIMPDESAVYAEVRAGNLSLPDIKRRIERECITRALAETGGNITKAATLLGMKRPRLSQLVKHYGLSCNDPEGSS